MLYLVTCNITGTAVLKLEAESESNAVEKATEILRELKTEFDMQSRDEFRFGFVDHSIDRQSMKTVLAEEKSA